MRGVLERVHGLAADATVADECGTSASTGGFGVEAALGYFARGCGNAASVRRLAGAAGKYFACLHGSGHGWTGVRSADFWFGGGDPGDPRTTAGKHHARCTAHAEYRPGIAGKCLRHDD